MSTPGNNPEYPAYTYATAEALSGGGVALQINSTGAHHVTA